MTSPNLNELLSRSSSPQKPCLLNKAEREVLDELLLQPVDKPLQVVKVDTFEFIGIDIDFVNDIYKVTYKTSEDGQLHNWYYRNK